MSGDDALTVPLSARLFSERTCRADYFDMSNKHWISTYATLKGVTALVHELFYTRNQAKIEDLVQGALGHDVALFVDFRSIT